MPRPLRPDVEDRWHHVMNRGIDHGDVFFADSDRIEFGQRLADILLWLVDEAEAPEPTAMAAFGFERVGAFRTAVSRARASMRNEPLLRDVQSRAMSLLSLAPITSRV